MIRTAAVLALAALTLASGGPPPDAPAPSSAAGVLLVANKGDHTLGIIDPVTGRQVATVEQSGVTGHEVVASPDGRTAYVPIYGDSGVGRPGSDGRAVDVVDLTGRQRVATFDLGRAERPHCAAFGHDGRLYVTTELTNTLTVLDPATGRVVDGIPTGAPESHMVALTRDGTRTYTSNVHGGTVSVIDLREKKVLAVIAVSSIAQRIALSVDDRWVFTADQAEPRLAVIDTATNRVKQYVPLPGIAYGTAPTPDGRWLVLALVQANQVGLLDLEAMRVVKTLDVPRAPQFVLVRPDGQVAYVSCDQSGRVAEIDLHEWKVTRLILAGLLADGLAWALAAPGR
jgi:YVTN family beta-propeller protein